MTGYFAQEITVAERKRIIIRAERWFPRKLSRQVARAARRGDDHVWIYIPDRYWLVIDWFRAYCEEQGFRVAIGMFERAIFVQWQGKPSMNLRSPENEKKRTDGDA